MSEQTVVIGDVVSVRSGTTNGHAWTIYKVTDGNGNDLGSCLGEVADQAKGLIGQRALIVNDTETTTKDGKSYTNLKFRSALPAPEPQSSNGNGDVDWDAKNLKADRRASCAIAFNVHGQDEVAAFALADKIVAYVYQSSPSEGFPKPPGLGAGAYNDEDIPF